MLYGIDTLPSEVVDGRFDDSLDDADHHSLLHLLHGFAGSYNLSDALHIGIRECKIHCRNKSRVIYDSL